MSKTEVLWFNCYFGKCYAQCTKIYKSLLQIWYTQTSIILYKTTPKQPKTTHLNSVDTTIWRTNSLRPMSNSTFPFTSKSRKWFSKLSLQIHVSTVTIRLWDTAQCASRQTEQCRTHRLMCAISHILILHFGKYTLFSGHCSNTKKCPFSLKLIFSSYFVYFESKI